MRIAKLQSITYDPTNKSISFAGLNPLSRRSLVAISVTNIDLFLDAVKDMIANKDAAVINYLEMYSDDGLSGETDIDDPTFGDHEPARQTQ